jgi:hypothetical protein
MWVGENTEMDLREIRWGDMNTVNLLQDKD